MKKLIAILSLLSMLFSFTAPTFAAAGTNHLTLSESLGKGEYLISNNGKYLIAMQHDGNLVLYKNDGSGTALWDSKTSGNTKVTYLWFHYSGYLVLMSKNDGYQWSATSRPAAYAELQDDGNFVLYTKKGGYPVWHTNTYER